MSPPRSVPKPPHCGLAVWSERLADPSAMIVDRPRRGSFYGFSFFAALLLLELFVFVATEFFFAQQAINDRHKKQSGERGKDQPADDRRPSGAFCSPPSPRPNENGSMPMIIASAVMTTGRNRVKPAESAASCEFFGLSPQRSSLAKLTTKILFAVATPMAIIAPMSDGTLRVVPVMKSIQMMPHNAPGSAMMMTNGSVHDWKLTTITK